MHKSPDQKSYFPSEKEKSSSEFWYTSKWFLVINAPWIVGAIGLLAYHFTQTGK